MKQVHFSRVIVAVAVFAAAFARAQGDAKSAPPAWVVSSTGTVARAEAGDVGAMEEIANGYRILAVSPNTESTDDERVAMIQSAAKWMHRRAKVIVKTPEVQALAEKGDEAAMMDLARSYLFLAAARTMEAKGKERKVMSQKARDWLRRRAEKAIAKGDIDTITKVSDEFINILGVPEYDLTEEERDMVFEESMRLLRRRAKIMADREGDVESVRKRAEAGDPAAQRVLGFRCSLGIDVEKDEKKAFEWTKKAAEQGDAKAMFNLANDYANGNGVAKDDWRAFDLWRRSHEIGWDAATEKLLSLSDEYRKEADKGNASAQFFMGVVHEYGYAGKSDAAKAVEWYRKAAEQGHPGAQTFLGFALLTGSGLVGRKVRPFVPVWDVYVWRRVSSGAEALACTDKGCPILIDYNI